MKNIFFRFGYYLIGSIILAFGIALSILSNLGAGAFDALNSNLSAFLKISLGKAMLISVLFCLTVTMILKPKWIYFVGTLLTFIISFLLDWFVRIIPSVENVFTLRVIYFIASLILLPLGIVFIIKSKMPLSPMDNLLVILVEKTKWSVTIVKTLIESSFTLLALIFGFSAGISFGAISIGTLIITFTIGPGIGLFMKVVKDIKV